MATTWDWGPVAQGLQGLMMHYAQKRQYEDLLKTLGTGMPGGGSPFGGPSSAPPSPMARTEDDNGMPLPGRPAPIMPAQGGSGFLPAGPGRAGEWDWMDKAQGGGVLGALSGLFKPTKIATGGIDPARPPGAGQGINPVPPGQGGFGGMDPRTMEILRKLPPQIGLPLLMQTMQAQMGGRGIKDVDPTHDIIDSAGNLIRQGRAKEGDKAVPLTADEVAQLGLPKGTVAQRMPNGQIGVISSPKEPKEATQTVSQQNAAALGLVPGTKEYNDYIRADTLPQAATGGGDANKPPSGYRWGKDGALEYIPGGPADPSGAGRNVRAPGAKMINDIGKVGTNLETMTRLEEGFQDRYGGNVILGDMANTIGRTVGDSTGQAQWWQDYQAYINTVRNQLFGAALTPQEKDEFLKAVVTPRMNPGEIKKNLARQKQLARKAASRQVKPYLAAGYNQEVIEGALGMSADDLEDRPAASPQATGLPQGWSVKVK